MLNKRSQRILKTCINCPIWTGLIPEREFWDANATWDEIRFSRYFSNKPNLSEKDDDVNDDNTMEYVNNEYNPGIFYFLLLSKFCNKINLIAINGIRNLA